MSKLTGVVFFHGGNTPPIGALACDGRTLAVAEYGPLFAAIGNIWNTTAGAATPASGYFRIPPQVRNGRGIYPSTTVGTVGLETTQRNKSHTHTASVNTRGNHTHTRAFKHEAIFRTGGTRAPYTTAGTHNFNDYTDYAGSHAHTITVNNTGAGVFRPMSIVANLCIWV